MAFWSSDVLALADKGVFRAALLAEFDFGDETDNALYWAGGFGPLKTADDRIWQGVGGLGKIDGLAAPIGTTAPNVTFTLSGVNARVAALARSQSANIKGRDCWVYIQVFGEDFATLLDFRTLWTGVMDLMTYKAAAGGIYTVSLTSESVWTGRAKPPYGEYTPTDQRARSPGDTGLDFVASLVQKTIWYP